MYIHVDHRWFKTILKKALSVLLIYSIFFTTSVNAGAAEKWEIVQNVYDHQHNTVKLTASKITQGASNSGVFKVEVPVSASSLGKTVKAMMWTGIAVAGVQAMLEGIGWIIDTGSKVIKREKPKVDGGTKDMPYAWCFDPGTAKLCYATAQSAATGFKSLFPQYPYMTTWTQPFEGYWHIVLREKPTDEMGGVSGAIQWVKNPYYDPDLTPEPIEYEYMSDSALGNEITGRGENKEPVPAAVTDAYNPNNPSSESPAPVESNKALNNANPQPEKEPDGEAESEKEKDEEGNETGKETTKFKLPNACEWFPAACDFFISQKKSNEEIKENQKEDIAQNKTFFEKVSDWFDWSKENDDLDDDNEPPVIKDIPIGTLDTSTFKGTAGCPSPIQVPVTFARSGTVEISYEPICAMASKWSFVAPFIGFFSGALIILGVGRKGEDSDT